MAGRAAPFPCTPDQSITLEVILSAVFGVEDDERRQDLRRNLVGILATTRSPRAIGMAVDRLRRLPAYRRTRRMLAETDRILLAEIDERRADPDLGSATTSSRCWSGRASRTLGDERHGAARPADDPAPGRSRTTATGLAWSFDLLFRAPDKLERLRAELAEGGHDYLDAVVEETLRIRPVVPWVGRKLSAATELGGYELPEDTVVMAAIYLAHTRPDVYPEPDVFRPERFLTARPDTYAWILFGGGTRRCIGAAFAQLEMRVCCSTVLAQAELGPAGDRPEPLVRRNVTCRRETAPRRLRRSPRRPTRS